MRIFLAISIMVILSACGQHEFSSRTAAGGPALTNAGSLSFTDMNLSWFGINGNPRNRLGNEPRVDSMKAFLKDNGLLTDVMVFEEVVDLPLLQNTVLDGQYECHTYAHNNPKHQHVAICHTLAYRLDIADGTDSYGLDSVNTSGNLRPAMHGILKTKNGTRVAHIFGVHLKANPDKSSVRMEQMQNLVDYIQQENGRDPVVIAGDFNTFNDDTANINALVQPIGLSELSFPEPYTWASATENFPPAKLDRVWIANDWLARVAGNHVKGPCSSGDVQVLADYNKKVSDHCPETFTVNQVL